MGILLKNAFVIDPIAATAAPMDLLVEDGVISALAAGIAAKGHEIIDCTGLYLAPGLVDMHVHFRDPGLTYKEDIITGSAAAAAGYPRADGICAGKGEKSGLLPRAAHRRRDRGAAGRNTDGFSGALSGWRGGVFRRRRTGYFGGSDAGCPERRKRAP